MTRKHAAVKYENRIPPDSLMQPADGLIRRQEICGVYIITSAPSGWKKTDAPLFYQNTADISEKFPVIYRRIKAMATVPAKAVSLFSIHLRNCRKPYGLWFRKDCVQLFIPRFLILKKK